MTRQAGRELHFQQIPVVSTIGMLESYVTVLSRNVVGRVKGSPFEI